MVKKISVLVPVYGVEEYIKQCSESLFNNSIAKDCEFIFINDKTKDKSIKILQEVILGFPTLDIKVIEHEANKGLAGARNTGLKNATGKYIICVDSDDWVEPNYLEDLYNEAEKADADIVTCHFYENSEKNEKKFKQEFIGDKENIYRDLLLDNIRGFVWCKLVRRQLFVDNGIEWIEGLNMWEDVYIDSQLFLYAKKFSSVDKYLYHYRISNATSIMHIKELKRFREQFEVLHKVKENLIRNKIFDKYKKEFYYKYILSKIGFSLVFICNGKYQKILFTDEDKKFMKNNIKMFTRLKQIYIKLVIYQCIHLLFLFSFFKSKIDRKYGGICNFSNEDLKFMEI